MPKGPRGEKRPADAVGAAVRVTRISVGDEDDDRQTEQPAASLAQQLGKLGGAARAKKLTPKQKSEIAKKAAAERWKR
jgi:hypothetical protein